MKCFVARIPLALVLIFLFAHPITTNGAENLPSNEPVVYSAEAVREDLAFLYETLQVSTYDLFLNTTKTDYDKAFEQVMNSHEMKRNIEIGLFALPSKGILDYFLKLAVINNLIPFIL